MSSRYTVKELEAMARDAARDAAKAEGFARCRFVGWVLSVGSPYTAVIGTVEAGGREFYGSVAI